MTTPDVPLETLAERALAGDRAALEPLCRALQGPLFRLSLRILGRPEDASDATQEILLQVVTHLSQFRGEARLLTWAYTVATRHLLRSRHKLARAGRVEVLEARIRQGLEATEPSSAPEGDARVLERETRLGCTAAMLECLTLEERIALVLDELGADDELGGRLCDVAPAAFRKRLSRARQKLRPILEELCGLAQPGAPCSCTRQARAKQLAGIETTKVRHLPLAPDPELVRTTEHLGALRRAGPVFAIEPPLDAPEALWTELRRRLPTLLGEGS
jgi:RNA polymerase sigma factor (sigma-70 family)